MILGERRKTLSEASARDRPRVRSLERLDEPLPEGCVWAFAALLIVALLALAFWPGLAGI